MLFVPGKKMTAISTFVTLMLGATLSTNVMARDWYAYDGYDDDGYSSYYDDAPIPLSMKIKINGQGRVGLRRLIERHHHIDTRNYRLRTVVVDNKATYPACAELSVGHRSSGVVDLQRGSTYIPVPRGSARGAWVLNVDAARLRRVHVELVPIRHGRGHDYSYRDKRDYDRHDRWDRWFRW